MRKRSVAASSVLDQIVLIATSPAPALSCRITAYTSLCRQIQCPSHYCIETRFVKPPCD